jgi:hypothetical protein
LEHPYRQTILDLCRRSTCKVPLAIYEQTTPARLRTEHACGNFSSHCVEADAGPEPVAEISKTGIESGITSIQYVLGTHPAQEFHLLSATHSVDVGIEN